MVRATPKGRTHDRTGLHIPSDRKTACFNGGIHTRRGSLLPSYVVEPNPCERAAKPLDQVERVFVAELRDYTCRVRCLNHAIASFFGGTWQRVADQLRPRWPRLADLMDASEHDVLAYMAFPRQHRTKLHSTNPIERLNKEVKRRADVVGIFPNEASIMRLIGAVLFEQNDEWQTSSRYMMVEAFAQIDKEEIDPIPSITTKAA